MRNLFTSLWRKKSRALQPSLTPVVASRERLDIPTGPLHSQEQSILFNRLSTELRLLVFSAVLTHSGRLLHILHMVPDQGESLHLSHWRCEDVDYMHPVWQHRCFGQWTDGDTLYTRSELRSNSDLLPLLLTCRSI